MKNRNGLHRSKDETPIIIGASENAKIKKGTKAWMGKPVETVEE